LLVALLVSGVASAMSFYFSRSGPDTYALHATDDTVMDASVVQSVEVPGYGSFQRILEKPLFRKDRSPVQLASVVISALDNWKLTGIVLSERNQLAIVSNTVNRSSRRIRVGQSLDGWELEVLEADGAEFVNGVQRTRLGLKTERR